MKLEQPVEISRSFRAMNTAVEIVLCVSPGTQTSGEETLRKTQRLFQQAEATFSRFNPESELCRLNSSAGTPFKASPMLFEVIRESIEAARLTGGIFDPAILPCLLAAGYDRSFEKLAERTVFPSSSIPAPKCRWQDIRLDARTSTVYLPPGCSLDLGGIGKGWTVDQACSLLENFTDIAVDAGGDIRVKGTKADGSPWNIGIADPFIEDRDLMVVDLPTGAICTSTVTRRKWLSDRKLQHHLIDPRSGRPALSSVVSATILAGSAVRAEIIAKSSLILGPHAGLHFIESQPGVSGLLVLADKRVLYSAGFKELTCVV